MVIVDAEIFIDSKYTMGANELMPGFRCTMKIEDKGYIVRINHMKKKPIHLNTVASVEIEILYGEIELMNLFVGSEFDLLSGKVIGKGKFTNIKEIYLECDAIMNLNVDEAKKIVKYAETMDNAVVDDKVYEYFEMAQ